MEIVRFAGEVGRRWRRRIWIYLGEEELHRQRATNERLARELAGARDEVARLAAAVAQIQIEIVGLRGLLTDRASSQPSSITGEAGSNRQPRLITTELRQLRTQGLRSAVNSILPRLAPTCDRKREYSRIAEIVTVELFGDGGGDLSRGVWNRLLREGLVGADEELHPSLGRLIEETAALRERIETGTVYRSRRGERFDPDVHEAYADCPDVAGQSIVEHSVFPAYRVNGQVFLKELVFTVQGPSRATSFS